MILLQVYAAGLLIMALGWSYYFQRHHGEDNQHDLAAVTIVCWPAVVWLAATLVLIGVLMLISSGIAHTLAAVRRLVRRGCK